MGSRSTSPVAHGEYGSSDSPTVHSKEQRVEPHVQPAQSSLGSSGEQTHALEAKPTPFPPPLDEVIEAQAVPVLPPVGEVTREQAHAWEAQPVPVLHPDEETANLMIDYAKHGRFDLLYPLLDRYPGSADVRPPYREYGLIHQAAFHGSEHDCKKLLEEYGADPRAKTKYGRLPSKVAKLQGYHALVAILRTYEEGSDGPAPDPVPLEMDDATAIEMIDFARDSRWDHVYDVLDDYKGAVNYRPADREFGLLHQAAWHGGKEECKKLLDEYGADPQAKTKSGLLPSEVAQQQGYTKLFGILRTYEDRDTALFEEAMNLATSASWEPLFSFLDEHKHLINFRPPHTPCNILHQAASQGDLSTNKKLVDDYGANPWLLSKGGQRASEVAEEKGFQELAAALHAYEDKSFGEAITVHVMQLSGEVLLGDVRLSLHDTVGRLRQLANEAFLKKNGVEDAVVAALITTSAKAPLSERWTIQEAGLVDRSSVTAVTSPDEVLQIEEHFHGLIMKRLRVSEKEQLTSRGFTFPSMKKLLENDGICGRGYWPVPGMCGGFSAEILKEEAPEPQWRLTCESRSRVVEGSGMRHEITAKGGVKLLKEGLL